MALSPIEQLFHNAALGEDLGQLTQVVNSKDHCNTPLHKASETGNLKMVKALILLGAEVGAKSIPFNLTPLHVAAQSGRTSIVKYFIEKQKIPLESKDGSGQTPLHHAGNVDVAKYLIEKGADIEAKDEDGNTPLNRRAIFCVRDNIPAQPEIDIAKYLIDMGAQIETKNFLGETPLHTAAECNFAQMVKYLIERGAQVNTRNLRNETPFDLADQNRHFKVAKHLLEKKNELEPPTSANNVSDQAPCIICFVPRNGIFALHPCGHASLCEPCCYKLKHEEDGEDSKCPSCREPIENYKKIFFQEPEMME